MEANVTTSTKSKRKHFDPELDKELRKQGINPDVVNDIDFEDGVDDYYDYSYTQDNYDEYGDDDY
jgi:hypothetical protein